MGLVVVVLPSRLEVRCSTNSQSKVRSSARRTVPRSQSWRCRIASGRHGRSRPGLKLPSGRLEIQANATRPRQEPCEPCNLTRARRTSPRQTAVLRLPFAFSSASGASYLAVCARSIVAAKCGGTAATWPFMPSTSELVIAYLPAHPASGAKFISDRDVELGWRSQRSTSLSLHR